MHNAFESHDFTVEMCIKSFSPIESVGSTTMRDSWPFGMATPYCATFGKSLGECTSTLKP